MYDRLKDIFHNVNDWLKFAEAKHAGLIVLNSGLVFGILTAYSSDSLKENLPPSLILFSLVFIALSSFFSFLSLFPIAMRKIGKKKSPEKANLFFAEDLAKFSKADLKEELKKQMKMEYEFDGLEDDLIQQIIVNSTIGTRKYKLFRIALVLIMIALAAPIIFMMGKLIGLI